MLAFSIWNALWVVFVTFLFINVLMLLFSVIADLFRDRELSGGAKAVWAIALIMFPLLGVLVYLVVRGGGMTQRSMQAEQQAKESVDAYIRNVAAGPATELERASALLASGQINEQEYAQLKAKILA